MSSIDTRLVAEMMVESLDRGQRPLLGVTSNSMSPLLRRDDRIQLEAVPWAQLTAGDIIVVARPAALFTHRYWGRMDAEGTTWLVTRGDRVVTFDRPVAVADYVGRVSARIRGGRRLDLQAGPGGRAARRCGRLAGWELRLLARLLNQPLLARAPAPGTPPLNYTTIAGGNPWLRLLRGVIRLVATLSLTGVRGRGATPGREDSSRP